jgi:hypothetical protein
MSLHYGFCNDVDGLTGLYCQNKSVWEGWMSNSGKIFINQPTLWSAGQWDVTAQSAASAGGPVGNMYVLIGVPDQVAPAPLAARLGYAQDHCPAFRGVFSLFFTGENDQGGFLWINGVPDVPGVQAKCYRMPKAAGLTGPSLIAAQGFAADRSVSDGWNNDRYDQNGIPVTNNNGGSTYGPSIPDANPAWIVFETLTDTSWGMGLDPSSLDVPSFQVAANTLLSEQLGLSYKWTSQDTIDTLIGDVLATIQGVLFVSPQTGLFTLKLLRGDYTVSDLPILTESNGKLTSFTRRLLGETHNCVSVTWTNPLTESNDTAMAFDPGSISRQGGCIVQSNSYPGVRNEILALQLAMRDLSSAAAPLAIIEAEVDRSFWGTSPGDCIVINYPEYGLSSLVCRVMKIDYGKPGASVIKLNLTEDVFSMSYAAYQGVGTSLWTYPDKTLVPVTNALVSDLPYYAVVNIPDGGVAKGRAFPESTVGIFASAPRPNTSVFQVYADVTDILGNMYLAEVGSKNFVGAGALGTALVQETTSTGVSLGVAAAVLDFVIFGTTEQGQEICIVSAVSGATVTLWRGLLDTTPRTWAPGTPFFICANPAYCADGTAHAAGSPVEFQLCPMVQGRVLSTTLAPVVTGHPVSRQNLPTRPANVKIGGTTHFGTYVSTTTADIDVTWANRNRLTEDLAILPWDSASVTPESGQTTSIKLWSADHTVLLWSATGLTGTSGTIPYSAFGGAAFGLAKLVSECDGLESLQGHEVLIQVPPLGGYGRAYGYKYGEA